VVNLFSARMGVIADIRWRTCI